MKLRKTIEVDVPIDYPWTVTPASSEFLVTSDGPSSVSEATDDPFALEFASDQVKESFSKLVLMEVMEQDTNLDKSVVNSLNRLDLWSTVDESPVIGTIKPKR